MIDAIKTEIQFLKDNKLDDVPWEETSLELIKRLTSDIHIKSQEKKEKLLDEVKDFLHRGGGKDDSFDFILQEDKKFFREVHIYRQTIDGKEKVVARIDRTMLDENGNHIPFENFITIEYDENGDSSSSNSDSLVSTNISIFGTQYMPFPANLIFAEHLFSKIAADVVKGVNHNSNHYRNMESKTLAEIPDIYATPEQKSLERRISEDNRYKIWSKNKQKMATGEFTKKDITNSLFTSALLAAIKDHDIKGVNTEGLTKEEILSNLMNRVQSRNAEEKTKLLREAKDFMDPNYGDDSFDYRQKIENGTIITKIEGDTRNNRVIVGMNFAEQKDKNKMMNFFNIIRMVYEPSKDNDQEYECNYLLIFGKKHPATPEWIDLAVKFHNFLLYELSVSQNHRVDLNNMNEIWDMLKNPFQNEKYISDETLEQVGFLDQDLYEDDFEYQKRKLEEEEKLRIKKKYEKLHEMDLNLKME